MKFPYKIEKDYELAGHWQRLKKKKKLLDQARPLSRIVLDRIKEDFTIEWTHHSNAIEGNTMTLAETKFILQEGITIGGKSLREHFEVINHKKAIDCIEDLVSSGNELRTIDVLSVHELVLNNIMDDFAGRLRQGMVRIVGANFTPPNARRVPDFLQELIEYINENPDKLDFLTLATVFHHRFVWIHPFYDGNGRTVRLVMNLILMRNGYPPCFILAQDRKRYISALNQANKGNLKSLTTMMYQAMERSLNIYLNTIGGDYEDYESISTIVKEPEIPYGQEYVSLLARKGRIDAYKEGRNWLTTKQAVLDYMASIR